MKASRVLKLITGLCCAAPLALTVFCLAPLVGQLSDLRGVDSIEGALPADCTTIIAAAVLFLLLTYGVMIALMIHLLRKGDTAGRSRLFWALLLFFGNIVSFPVYWYLHIWRGGDSPAAGKGRRVFMQVLFFAPLALFIFIIALTGIYGARGETLPGGVTFAWAAIFDLFFFPILVYLVVKAAGNRELSPAKKALWIALLVLLNMIVFPLYASRHLRGAQDDGPSHPQGGENSVNSSVPSQ
ncbi:MAG: hypothetical protein JW838_10310 [Spirochaetes bacterium]|nr:hypothetical protein [Spirochaetota bacterium]